MLDVLAHVLQCFDQVDTIEHCEVKRTQRHTMADKKTFYFSTIANDVFKKEIEPNVLLAFEEKKKMFYSSFWNELSSSSFFMCFVTSIREVAKENVLYDPQIYDEVFTTFLKALINPNYDNFIDYMKSVAVIMNCKWYLPDFNGFINRHPVEAQNAVKETIEKLFGSAASPDKIAPKHVLLDIYNYHLKCASSFIELRDVFVDAEYKASNFIFTYPESWKQPTEFTNPFEGFLRERFSDVLLSREGMFLGPKQSTELVSWWKAPVKVGTTPPSPTEMQVHCTDTVKALLGSFKPTDCHVSELPSNGYDPSWPPSKAQLRKHQLPSKSSFFQKLRNVDKQLWRMCRELLCCPVASRYHTINTAAIFSPDDKKFMVVGPWLVQWMEVFGAEALRLLQAVCEKKMKMVHSLQDEDEVKIAKCIFNWEIELRKGVEALKEIKSTLYAPSSKDFIKTSGEFLLEPCVLIQLPWNFVLLYQWLALALIEVMKFEVVSMEVRHWPLPKGEVETTARQLLYLVSKTKECVLRGLFLLCKQTLEKGYFSKTPALIMDTCVLPATPALTMLCNGKAYDIIHAIKSAAFSKPVPLDSASHTLLPESVYLISDINLENFYINFVWHLLFWLEQAYQNPVPSMNFELLETSKCANTPSPRSSFNLTPGKFSRQEDYLFDFFFKHKWVKGLTASQVDEALTSQKTVIDELFKQKMFPNCLREPMLSTFNSFRAKDLLSGMKLASLSHLNTMQYAVACGSLYLEMNDNLCGIDKSSKKEALLTWLVRLSGEVVEREQLVRTACACGLLIGVTPSLLTLEETPVSSLVPMLRMVKDAVAQHKRRNRSWLWKQLPASWGESAAQHKSKQGKLCHPGYILGNGNLKPQKSEGDSDHTMGTAVRDTVVQFEKRLGSLVLACAKNNFVMWEMGCQEYLIWRTAHYLLPCHLASLLACESLPDTPSTRGKIQSYINLLHNLFLDREAFYDRWTNSTSDRVKYPHTSRLKSQEEVSDSHILGLYDFERVMQLLHAFVGLGAGANWYEGVYGYEIFSRSLTNFKNTELEPKASDHPFKILAYKAWFDVGKVHLSFLHENAVKTWKPPAPGYALKNEGLKKAYFASVLFELFEVVLQSNEGYNLFNAMADQKSNRELHDVSLHFIFWRCHLLSMVAQCEGLVPPEVTNEQLANFGVEAEDIMYKLWQLIRKVRACYDHKKLKKQLPDNLMNDKKMKKAVKDFYAGNLEIINKMLQLNCTAKRKNELLPEILNRWFENKSQGISVTDTVDKPKSKAKKLSKPKNVPAKECRWCKKKEDEPGRFMMCEECKKDKYPDVNYFCSSHCQVSWWEMEHMAEHLEFSLGLKTFD